MGMLGTQSCLFVGASLNDAEDMLRLQTFLAISHGKSCVTEANNPFPGVIPPFPPRLPLT